MDWRIVIRKKVDTDYRVDNRVIGNDIISKSTIDFYSLFSICKFENSMELSEKYSPFQI